MLFRFSGGAALGVHLGMTGHLRDRKADFEPGKHDHLVLFQRQQALVFRDARMFGRIKFSVGKDRPRVVEQRAARMSSRRLSPRLM